MPCIKMEENVFAKDSFVRFAAANLEMVCADFPRMKKHKLAGELLRLENSPLDAELPALGELDSRTLDGAADDGLGTLDGAPLDRLDDENSDAPLLTRLLPLGPALGADGAAPDISSRRRRRRHDSFHGASRWRGHRP